MERLAQPPTVKTEPLVDQAPARPKKRPNLGLTILWGGVLAVSVGLGAAVAGQTSFFAEHFRPVVARGPVLLPALTTPLFVSVELGRIRELLKEKRYVEARLRALDCVYQQAGQPECHLLLGTANAKIADYEGAEEEYRHFLRLAPPDLPDVNRVRAILDAYAGAEYTGTPGLPGLP